MDDGSLGPRESTIQIASSSVQPFCTAHGRVSSGMPWHVLYPKNCLLAWGDLDPHLIHGSLGSPESMPTGHCDWFSRFCRSAEHVRFSRIRQVAPCAHPCNTRFFGTTRVHYPHGISIGSAIFAQITAESSYTLHWATLFTQNCLFPWGSGPHLIYDSFGPSLPVAQTESILV